MVVVRATDAIRLCQEDGCERVPAVESHEQIDRLRLGRMADVRDFAARAMLSSCFLYKGK